MTVRPDNVPYTAEEQPDGTWVLLELTDVDGAIHKEGWAPDGTRLYLDELDAETRVRRRIVLFLPGGVAELDFETGRGDVKRTDLDARSLGPRLPDFPDVPEIVECMFEMLETDAAQMSYEVGRTAFRDASRRWVGRDGEPTERPEWLGGARAETSSAALFVDDVVELDVAPVEPVELDASVVEFDGEGVLDGASRSEIATEEMARDEDDDEELLDTQDAAVTPEELGLSDFSVAEDELLDTQDTAVSSSDVKLEADDEAEDEFLDTQDTAVSGGDVKLEADDEAEEELLDTQDADFSPDAFELPDEAGSDDDTAELLDTQDAALTPEDLGLLAEPDELDIELEPLSDNYDDDDELFLSPDSDDELDVEFEPASPPLAALESLDSSKSEAVAAAIPPSLDELEAAPPSLDELEAAPPSLDELEATPPSLDELEAANTPDSANAAPTHSQPLGEDDEDDEDDEARHFEALSWDPTRLFIDETADNEPRDGRWINTHRNDALHFEAHYEDGALVSLSQRDTERNVQFKRTLRDGEEMLVLYKNRGTLTYVRTPSTRSVQIQYDGLVELTRKVELDGLATPEDFAEKFELYQGLSESFPFDEMKQPWRIDALGFVPTRAFVDRFDRYFEATIFAENEQGDWLVLIEEPGPHAGKIFVNYQLDGLYHLDLLDEYVAEYVDHEVADDPNRLIEELPFFDYRPIASDLRRLYESIDFRLEDESVLEDLRPVPEIDLSELSS